MTRPRWTLVAAGGVLAAVVVGTVSVTGGGASDLVLALLAVVVLVILLDGRLAARQSAMTSLRRLRAIERAGDGARDAAEAAAGRAERRLAAVDSGLDDVRAQLAEARERLAEVRVQQDLAVEANDKLLAVGYTYRSRVVEWRQVEALHSLYALLPPRQVIPPMRGWAASPDLLAWLVGHLLEHRPRLVLECGSGVSTLWTAYALQHLGAGRVVALEHDPRYAEATRAEIRRHGLLPYADVRLAPITPATIGDEEWPWYDATALENLHDVDLLVVDGPPSTTGPLARYPAVPLVADRLSADAYVVLDDAEREDEQAIAARWQRELELSCVRLTHLEKHAFVLRPPLPEGVTGGSQDPPAGRASRTSR